MGLDCTSTRVDIVAATLAHHAGGVISGLADIDDIVDDLTGRTDERDRGRLEIGGGGVLATGLTETVAEATDLDRDATGAIRAGDLGTGPVDQLGVEALDAGEGHVFIMRFLREEVKRKFTAPSACRTCSTSEAWFYQRTSGWRRYLPGHL